MLITAGWRRLFRRNCIWVVVNDSEVTYGYKKSESSLNLRCLPKEPPFKGSFHLHNFCAFCYPYFRLSFYLKISLIPSQT